MVFIISGVISMPSGMIGYLFNADFPKITRAFYLNKAEAEWARQRTLRGGFAPPGKSAWDRKKVLRIIREWQIWVLSFGYFFVQASLPSQQPTFKLWLKADKYSVYQVNVLRPAHDSGGRRSHSAASCWYAFGLAPAE